LEPESEMRGMMKKMQGGSAVTIGALLAALALGGSSAAQTRDAETPTIERSDGLVQLDFDDVELTVIIDTIAKLTRKNFIYDDRVRGRVTIVSPTPVTSEEAYAVFESVLKVKGFTAVPGPGGVMKIIPVRDAKESSIETIKDDRASANRDHFVTRLIPLLYIDADAITATIKPLVSKDASMVAYAPTNTIILTDTAANIRRLLGILDAIDVETHKEELAVIKILYADATTLGQQISEIYGASVTTGGAKSAAAARRSRASRRKSTAATAGKSADLATVQRGEVRIMTDDRTNSLIVMAARAQLGDIRDLVRKLDVPVVGGGRIHVYYLKHADSEELSKTLTGLVSGRSGAAAGPGRTGAAAPQALRSVVSPLVEGKISINADPATNSLVIQASKEAYETLLQVIEQLDISRPQVLVEALIMEVDVSDALELGFSGVYEGTNGDISWIAATAASGGTAAPLLSLLKDSGSHQFTAEMHASAAANLVNIVSAPHILTSDNEEAEIRIGNNIPIITSRVNQATGAVTGLASSVNVERQDIGVTLRVTPQISEGNTVRLKIFQEITAVNDALTAETGEATEVGVALSSRRIENTVVVNDGETVVIGGLISEQVDDIESKVPWLGDIPVLGWLFKVTEDKTRKINLLVFLTPHIVRGAEDLESETIRKREEFTKRTIGAELYEDTVDLTSESGLSMQLARELVNHRARYPLERMSQIEVEHLEAEAAALQLQAALAAGPRYGLSAALPDDETSASAALTEIIDWGYDATLVSRVEDGQIHFEIQIGPFETQREARSASRLLERAMELNPQLTVIPRDPDGVDTEAP